MKELFAIETWTDVMTSIVIFVWMWYAIMFLFANKVVFDTVAQVLTGLKLPKLHVLVHFHYLKRKKTFLLCITITT